MAELELNGAQSRHLILWVETGAGKKGFVKEGAA